MPTLPFLLELWDHLRLSASPYRAKVRAILTCAWPKGLYGVALCVTLGFGVLSRDVSVIVVIQNLSCLRWSKCRRS
jgi:hypothetical protein